MAKFDFQSESSFRIEKAERSSGGKRVRAAAHPSILSDLAAYPTCTQALAVERYNKNADR